MKAIRFACLVMTFAVLAYTPTLFADTCCVEFTRYCQGLCVGHQGMEFDDCNVGGSGSDYCFCNDGTVAYGQPSGVCSPF